MSDTAYFEQALDKKFESRRGDALRDAPVSALSGVTDAHAALLEQSLKIRTIGDLASNRFVVAAQALARLSAEGATPAVGGAYWARVTITYGGTGYTQNYKRNIGSHSHPGQQAFVQAARADSLTRINAHLPAGHPIVLANQLGQNNLVVNTPDPGGNYRLI